MSMPASRAATRGHGDALAEPDTTDADGSHWAGWRTGRWGHATRRPTWSACVPARSVTSRVLGQYLAELGHSRTVLPCQQGAVGAARGV